MSPEKDERPISNSRAARLYRQIVDLRKDSNERREKAVTKSTREYYEGRTDAYDRVLQRIEDMWEDERLS